MARLNTVDPANATGKAKEIFEGPLKGKHLNIFKGMANSPAALQAYLGMSGALGQGTLSPAEREVIALAVGQHNECEYCLAAHTMMGKGAGLSEEQTLQARRGELNDAKLNALAGFAKTLVAKNGWAEDTDIKAFKQAGYTDEHVVEAIANVGLNLFTNYFNHVNDTPLDLPKAAELSSASSH
ncbi:MAG: carboxymuconolactone decarboxylase family protein [Phycisphaeraceae bacterium]|nr:carboxymuconolactone decarboxylase family protein [Phycisphaeraceae bacterium]